MMKRNKVRNLSGQGRLRPLDPPRLPVIGVTTNEMIASHERMHQLSRFGEATAIAILLSKSKWLKMINVSDVHGATPLHYASRYQQYSVVKLLLKHKAKVNVKDREGATALHYVCKKKQAFEIKAISDIIHALLKGGASVRCADAFEATPLHYATTHGNLPAVACLLTVQDIDINCRDHVNVTPLHAAITCHQHDIAARLIRAGADIYAENDDKEIPLHLAAMEGSLFIVNKLFDAVVPSKVPRNMINMVDVKGNNALHFAIEGRYIEVVRALIERGVDVNATCRDNTNAFSPLHLAAISGNVDICLELLANGAELECIDKRGCIPLHWSAEYGHSEVTDVLLADMRTNKDVHNFMTKTALMIACIRGDVDTCKVLLSHGVDVTLTDNRERTALYLAVESGHLETTKFLLKQMEGKKHLSYLVNETEQAGNTPLHCACFRGDLDIVKILCDNGTQLNCKNENGRSAFQLAVMAANIEVCRYMYIRSKGKCLNDRDEDSNTALHLAVSMQCEHIEDIVKLLVEWGSDKEARNCNSGTPLDFAIISGNLDVVEYLMDIKLAINIEEGDKLSPLQLACKHGHVAIVKALLQRGADVTATDIFSRNALDIAVNSNNRNSAAAILNSDQWKQALHNETRTGGNDVKDTPLRHIVDKMPDVALLILDKCVTISDDIQNRGDPDFFIEFNYEFLEDTYVNFNEGATGRRIRSDSLFDMDGMRKLLVPYTNDLTKLKSNHLLQIMVDKKRDEVILHPVVMSLVRRKWYLANFLYMTFIYFYCGFVVLFSVFMVYERPPFYENSTVCETLHYPIRPDYQQIIAYLVIFLALIGIANELIQLLATRWKYISKVLNFVDWLGYGGAIATCLNFTNCKLRTDWQWQLGALTLFLIWMELILLMRIFPIFGVFAVMILEILKTFSRFAVMYLMFLIAFGLSFYLLLNNQHGFSRPLLSIIKSAVYHLGEVDYAATFHSPPSGSTVVGDTDVVYKTAVYIIFIAYLILMSIVVINLLTALAVDDVNKLREIARLERIDMQIELALDVEIAMPSVIMDKLCPLVIKEKWFPNKESTKYMWLKPLMNYWKWLTQGRLDERILNAVISIESKKSSTQKKKGGGSSERENIQDMGQQLDRIEDMLMKAKKDMNKTRHRRKRD